MNKNKNKRRREKREKNKRQEKKGKELILIEELLLKAPFAPTTIIEAKMLKVVVKYLSSSQFIKYFHFLVFFSGLYS